MKIYINAYHSSFDGYYLTHDKILTLGGDTIITLNDEPIIAKQLSQYEIHSDILRSAQINDVEVGDVIHLVPSFDVGYELDYWLVGTTSQKTYNDVLDIQIGDNWTDGTTIWLETKLSVYNISASSNPNIATPFISQSTANYGDVVSLKARSVPNYRFSHWQDGSTENEHDITIYGQTDVIAYYIADIQDSTIYQWIGLVKDMTDLESVPKAFLTILECDVKQDLLTTANSSFTCLQVPSNVSNGDVLMVTNPQGIVRYLGVIKSIEENKISCYQMQHFFSGTWVQNNYPTATTIEAEFKYLLGQFAKGYLYGSTYRDLLVNQEKGSIVINSVDSTNGNLETMETNKTIDMEKFIYSLYEKYGILLDFDIKYSGQNSVTIKKPNYSSIKIGDNTNAIVNLSPITQVEETNKLVIFDKDGTYRTTYIAKADGTIVEEPSSSANRFGVVNTKVVFSDDEVTDLISANLPSQMYNHKLTFTLRLNNNLYKYDDLKLGMPLQIWIGTQFFSTIITGREFKKSLNQNVSEVNYTAGLVRTSLTKLLSLRNGVQS